MTQLARIKKALYQPVTLGAVLSLAGILCFLLAVFGTSVMYSSGTASVCFQGAGWFVGSGWLLERCEAGLWPFKGSLKRPKVQGHHMARITAIFCLTMIAFGFLLTLAALR